jgi:diguanylate cyclase (GGDEF)-like protein/PAS domain S-box-containing protein
MSESHPKILVVDDSPEMLASVSALLSEDHYEVHTAETGREGLQQAWEQQPDLMLIDLGLPDMNGLDLCRALKKERCFQNVPFVILSGASDVTNKVEGFEAGAMDFIAKPFHARELSARIRTHLRNKFWNDSIGAGNAQFQQRLREIEGRFLAIAENSQDLIFELDAQLRFAYLGPNCNRVLGCEPGQMVGTESAQIIHPDDQTKATSDFQKALLQFKSGQSKFRLRRADNSWRWMETTCVAFYTVDQQKRLVCIGRDVTVRQELEDQLAHMANHDSLTELFNRQFLVERLASALQSPKEGVLNAVLYIDLDNFKIVNDNHGHMVGDRILCEFAGRLRGIFGQEAILSRFGGDEFVVLLEQTSREKTLGLAERIRQMLEGFYFHEGIHTFELNASLGVAFTDSAASAQEMLKRADDACYIAKMRGRNRVEVYSPDSSEINRLRHDSQWSALIKSSLKEQRFELWYQPIVKVGTGEVELYEALIRLRSKDGAILLPGEFLSAAARWGMMIKLDRHVIRLGVNDLARYPLLKLSINLSAESLLEPSLPKFVQDTFSRAGVAPGRVIFEITETEVIANFAKAMDVLKTLRAAGFKFALDDFGVGFSSMAYLRNLPVDRIKIDGIFINNMDQEPYHRMLARSINEIGHFLGKTTVAEFVDSEAILQLCREIGIDYAQGNYFGAASPASALAFAEPCSHFL